MGMMDECKKKEKSSETKKRNEKKDFILIYFPSLISFDLIDFI